MSDRDNFGSFLMGFIIGGLAGAAASLLLAPQSGEETRTLIKDKAIVIRERTSETVEEAYKQAEVAAQEAIRKAEDLLAKARSQAEEVQRRGQMIIEKPRGGQGAMGDIEQFAEEVKDTAAEHVEEITDEIEQKADELEDKGDELARG